MIDLPGCMKCSSESPGRLVPLSDYGPDGATILIKAWVCTNSKCGFMIRQDKGIVHYGKVAEGGK